MSHTLPTTLPIATICDEADGIKTFTFEHALGAQPGQFVMVWLPGVDEKPFSVWTNHPDRWYLTVSAVGPFSRKLHELKPGDQLSYRGPFGRGFTIPTGKRVTLIGGGFGTAPLLGLAHAAIDCEIDIIIGARTSSLLFGESHARAVADRVHIATDDGSAGIHGYGVVILEDLLKKNATDVVYTCGPERMMHRVAELCRDYGIPCELSIERYMKCGFGVCGACACDDTGWRACADGPTASGELALSLPEFGQYHRDSLGRVV